jgi:hypothetical protein
MGIMGSAEIVLDLYNADQVLNKYLRGNGLIAFENAGVRSYYLILLQKLGQHKKQ